VSSYNILYDLINQIVNLALVVLVFRQKYIQIRAFDQHQSPGRPITGQSLPDPSPDSALTHANVL